MGTHVLSPPLPDLCKPRNYLYAHCVCITFANRSCEVQVKSFPQTKHSGSSQVAGIDASALSKKEGGQKQKSLLTWHKSPDLCHGLQAGTAISRQNTGVKVLVGQKSSHDSSSVFSLMFFTLIQFQIVLYRKVQYHGEQQYIRSSECRVSTSYPNLIPTTISGVSAELLTR